MSVRNFSRKKEIPGSSGDDIGTALQAVFAGASGEPLDMLQKALGIVFDAVRTLRETDARDERIAELEQDLEKVREKIVDLEFENSRLCSEESAREREATVEKALLLELLDLVDGTSLVPHVKCFASYLALAEPLRVRIALLAGGPRDVPQGS